MTSTIDRARCRCSTRTLTGTRATRRWSGGSGSPFPDAADVSDQAALGTYADRYARENAAPGSADVNAARLAVRANGRS